MRRSIATLLLAAPLAFGQGTPSPSTRPANRLADEKSPYLLQHAHNPVDWYPWGPDAFAKAKRENKPILLSIGYSTCHWCHVMERESFDNPAIAKLINAHFVPVKVDREERPDIDRIYMTFVQATTGSGGWPLTVFLTPDAKPFYGGTYFPPEPRAGMVSFPDLLEKVGARWNDDREKILKSADAVADAMKDFAKPKADPQARLDAALLDKTFQSFAAEFDADRGGFGEAPKFPRPTVLRFLLTYHARTGSAPARDMALKTLRAMADGGLHDHLGGGFHRYSTDARWFLPHFEKMLYDQAQLADAYLDAYQLTRDPFYASVARDVFDYVLRDLTGKQGQFYSAEDADSAVDPNKPKEKREGAFYVWGRDEIERLAGKDGAAVVAFVYGVEPNGNVQADPHHEFTKKNVLYRAKSDDEAARQFNRTPDEIRKTLSDARSKLLAARSVRPRPHLDDKTLVAWNGLMISALARGGVVLDEPKYTSAAVAAATFIRANLYDANTKTLTRRYREGSAAVSAFADDYAFLIAGLLDLYETTLDVQWLRFAIDLQAKQDELFWDNEAGGYFSTVAQDGLLLRMKEHTDDAEPSPNSVSAFNLLRLSQMLDDKALMQRGEKTLRSGGELTTRAPAAMPLMMAALDFHSVKPKQIVLAGNPASPDLRAMLREVHSRYLPNKILLGADGGEGQRFLARHARFLELMEPLNGTATAFVCENYVCQQPTSDLAELRKHLTRK